MNMKEEEILIPALIKYYEILLKAKNRSTWQLLCCLKLWVLTINI